MNTGIIIQARIGSSRLPKKMVLPFYGEKGIFETILLRLKEAELNIPIIVATSINEIDDQIENIALFQNISCFRGSENNVLGRFVEAAEAFHLEKIIRICADNPLLDIKTLKHQIEDFSQREVDYWCYSKRDGIPTIRTHYGFWTEGVSSDALKRILKQTNEKEYLEHVTNFIYTHPEDFKIYRSFINPEIEKETQIRLTVDTLYDFDLAKEIYSFLITNKLSFDAEQIISEIKKKSSWINIMTDQIKHNLK